MNYKKDTQTRGCMKSVMRYVSQLSKTLWDGQQLVSGIGCQPETAFDEFLSTKLLHHKDGGVMFYHMVQSFPKGANIDPRTAHEAARQLAGYFEGCEVLVCTHTDREHIHSHCIINSVNFETGKKVHMADKQIQELRVRNDQICEELGLPKFQKDEQWQSRGMSNAEYYTAVKGESWKFELMRVIDDCMRCAGNREEFLALLRSEGYSATWTDSRKNITYITPDGRKWSTSPASHVPPSFLPQPADRTLDAQSAACMGQRYAVAEFHEHGKMFSYIFVQHHDRKRHVECQAGAALCFRRLLNVHQIPVRIVHERAGMAAQPVESQPLVLAGDCAVKIVFRLTEDQVDHVLFVHVKNSFTFFSVYCSTAFPGLSRLRHNFAAESSAVKQGASDPPQGPVQFWTHLKNLSLKIEHISPILGRYPQK